MSGDLLLITYVTLMCLTLMFVTKVVSEDGLFVTNDATRSLEKRCLDGNLPFLADRAM